MSGHSGRILVEDASGKVFLSFQPKSRSFGSCCMLTIADWHLFTHHRLHRLAISTFEQTCIPGPYFHMCWKELELEGHMAARIPSPEESAWPQSDLYTLVP